MSAESIDTHRAMQLLEQIHQARRDHASARAEVQALEQHLAGARQTLNRHKDRVEMLHKQFDLLTDPESAEASAEPSPSHSASGSRRSAGRSRAGTEDLTSTS